VTAVVLAYMVELHVMELIHPLPPAVALALSTIRLGMSHHHETVLLAIRRTRGIMLSLLLVASTILSSPEIELWTVRWNVLCHGEEEQRRWMWMLIHCQVETCTALRQSTVKTSVVELRRHQLIERLTVIVLPSPEIYYWKICLTGTRSLVDSWTSVIIFGRRLACWIQLEAQVMQRALHREVN
jgi:hypothetical protein